jgi:hypothetical protein
MSIRFREEDKMYWEKWLPPDMGERLERIRESVTRIHNELEGNPPLAFYTPHGINHLKAVEENIHFIIPAGYHKKLSESEKFFLLGSAWLHDLGMLRGIFNQDYEIDETIIRARHHKRSEKFIIEHWKRCDIEEYESPAFALLALFHRRRSNISECSEYFEVPNHGTIRLRCL